MDNASLKAHIENSIRARVDAARPGVPPTADDVDRQNTPLNQAFQPVPTAFCLLDSKTLALIASFTNHHAYGRMRSVHSRLRDAVPRPPPPLSLRLHGQIWMHIAAFTNDDARRALRLVHPMLRYAIARPLRPICENWGCNNTCKLWRRTCGSRYCRPEQCCKCYCHIHPECTHRFWDKTYCREHAPDPRCDRCGAPMWDWECGECLFG